MTNAKVSIVAACYNHVKYLPFFMDSILSQDYENWELIITDDCSTDGSYELLQTYKDERIKLYRNDKNRHLCDTINHSLSKVSGDYVCIIYTDDGLCPEKLSTDVAFMKNHPETDVLYSRHIKINETNERINIPQIVVEPFTRLNLLNKMYTHGNIIAIPGMFFKKSCLDKIGHQNRLLRLTQDYEYHIRMLFEYECAIGEEATVLYRIRDGEANLSAPNRKFYNAVSMEIHLVLKEYLKHIKTAEQLLKVFPECTKYGEPVDEAVPYFLGRIAVESDMNSIRAFGLEVIYDFMSNDENIELLENKYNFLCKDYMHLVNEHSSFKKFKTKKTLLKRLKNLFK